MGGLKVENVKFQDILQIYEKEIKRNVKNKKKLYNFEKNKFQNLVEVYNDLKNNHYKIEHYNIFLIREPKKRIVMSLNIHDKIINHYVTKFILIPKLEKYLDIRNIATRKNMGTDYGIKLLKKYLELTKKYDNVYVLKIDISKYFYNIDHDILKSMLLKDLTEEEYEIIATIINSTNEKYVHKVIEKYQNNDQSLPNYEQNKGLPIGNLTSQFLSIFYLHSLDHFIIHNLHLKYYVRYMDDIIILSTNKKYLEKCLQIIEERLNNIYKLQVNKKKTKIINAKNGFVFLGYSFQLYNKKTIIKIRQETMKKIKHRIKHVNYLYEDDRINFEKFFATINNYQNSLKFAHNIKIKKYIFNSY